MGCSNSKSSDVRNPQVVGSIPGSLRGIRRKAPRSHGKDARKVHQNADVQHPALCPASWPELNLLLCKLKQETPMFREIINTPEHDNGDGKTEHPRRSRRTMSVSLIRTVEDVDAAVRKASEEETRMRDDFAVDYRAPGFDPVTSEAPGAKLGLAEEEEEEEDLECRCPPNGEHRAVLYTTSLRGIRKTYEDCQRAKAIVESYGVSLDERDVAMDSGFLRELKSLTERGAVVPKLFVRGKYVGGAEAIVELHDDGKLGGLLCGLPRGRKACDGCGGLHFFPCVKCNGSCKVLAADGGSEVSRCSDCNENGLVQCPFCSSSSSSPSGPL